MDGEEFIPGKKERLKTRMYMLIEIFWFFCSYENCSESFLFSIWRSWEYHFPSHGSAVRMPCMVITIHFGLTGPFLFYFIFIFNLSDMAMTCFYFWTQEKITWKLLLSSLFCLGREKNYWTFAGSITLLLQSLGKLKALLFILVLSLVMQLLGLLPHTTLFFSYLWRCIFSAPQSSWVHICNHF